MAGLYCGIDIGTTNIKVVLMNDHGEVVARETQPTPRLRQGAVSEEGGESDALALVSALESLILLAWRRAGTARTIDAVSTAGVGEDGVLVDAALNPLTPAIPWFDLRASQEAEELRANYPREAVTGIGFDPTRTAAKWLWLARHGGSRKPYAHAWIAPTDYPLVHWARQPFMCATLAARTACYDVGAREWVTDLLSAASAPPLPHVVGAGTVIGRMGAGMLIDAGAASPETRLIAGGHDHPVAASVIRRLSPLAIVDSLGTAELIYAERRHRAELRPGIVRSVPVLGGEGDALLKVFEFASALAPLQIASDAGTLLTTVLSAPAMPGEPDPREILLPDAMAASQLTEALAAADGNSRLLIAQRLLEGCAYLTGQTIDDLIASGAERGPVFTTGGWSRSDALVQLRADVLGRGIFRLNEPELAALGAAMIAADGIGAFSDKMLQHLSVEEIKPDADRAARYARLPS